MTTNKNLILIDKNFISLFQSAILAMKLQIIQLEKMVNKSVKGGMIKET